MTYSAIAVARMPNIQISIDAQSLSPLTGAIATFNGYLATPSTHSTFTGELNSQFVAQSNTIQVLKKTLVLCNLRAKDPQFVSSDHITSFGIYDQSTNTLLSQQADNKQWTFWEIQALEANISLQNIHVKLLMRLSMQTQLCNLR